MKSNKNRLLQGTLALGIITAASAYASDLEKEVKTMSLNTNGLTELSVDAGAGFLVVNGVEQGDKIEVTADMLVNDDNYKLSLDISGDKAVLVADANTNNMNSWFSDESPKIDLTITVPAGMALSIDDGSGAITVAQINNNVVINDGSGSIKASQIEGTLSIKDGSGSINVSDVSGHLKIKDGSGKITVLNTQSDVVIDDSSGSLSVVNVAGKVDIEDGSGSLVVTHVAGHVTIDDGSGGIEVSHLKDGLTIVNAGSGGISIDDVEGDVNLND